MAFVDLNFSPVGNNARAGNVPQVFSYLSEDTKAAIIANGYFNELKGYLRRGDWIDITSDLDSSVGQSMHFVLGDGQSPAIFAVRLIAGGTTYSIDDLVVVTVVGSGVIQKPVLKVTALGGGDSISAVSIVDPGLFDATNMPADFIALNSTSPGSGSGAEFSIFPSQSTEGVRTASVGSSGGTGYNIGEQVTVNLSGGTVFSNPILEVLTAPGNVVGSWTVISPGSFDPLDLPGVSDVTTTAITGSGTGANANLATGEVLEGLASPGFLEDITLSELAMTAA